MKSQEQQPQSLQRQEPISAEVIHTSEVLADKDKLPFIGYTFDVDHVEDPHDCLVGAVKLSSGGQPEATDIALSWDIDSEGTADASRDIPLIEAMLDFLNTGGDPTDLHALAKGISSLPQIRLNNFRLLDIHIAMEREVFYFDQTTGEYIRVIPDAYAESMTQAQFMEIIAEEYKEILEEEG